MGARVFKTGLAVTLASAICLYFQIPVIFAALSAVVNIKPSIIQSWKNALEQTMVHLLGVCLAFAVGLTLGANPLTMGLTTVMVIWLCGRWGLASGTLMGVLAALFILTATPEEFVPHALERTGSVFVGLLAALSVNYLILPPRFVQMLRAVLSQLAEEVVNLFETMIESFVRLERVPDEDLANRKERIQTLLEQAGDLLSRYREQVGKVKPKGARFCNNPVFLEEYLRYQVGIYEKSLGLAEVIQQRIRRREEVGNPPLSEEFQQVLAHVNHGAGTVIKLNQQLRQAIVDGKAVMPMPATNGYWDELAQIMEVWHGKFSGSYYLYALIEVGSVIGEIRWAANKARELFALIEKK